MVFNPLAVFDTVSRSYEDYVKSTFFINEETFRKQFNDLVDEKGFTKGPIIECTDSFITGDSVFELVQKKVLNPGFTKIIRKESEINRGLYKHQIDAIEKSNQDKNLVVTTGTGSGKTECFLYPILNALLNEADDHVLSPGVRALLLYPMNALANDQMKRLRDLLADVPEITFGAYTGETRESDKEALANYQDLNNTKPLSNEIISRQSMKANPPHILLTNYAMLEYLLLRPNDTVFFDSDKALHWKYIVLDEAHTYRGASGIEISYLIRRLYNRLQQREKIRFILTSATLGDQEKNAQILEFAENISAGQEYSSDDIIRAKRREWKPIVTSRPEIDITVYKKILLYLDTLECIGEADLCYVQEITGISCPDGKEIREYLHEIVLQDPLYTDIRSFLQNNCVDLYTIATEFNIDPLALSAFLTIAGMAQDQSLKLVDLRYHAFIRSLEGVYVTFFPNKTLSLAPRKKHVTPDGDFTCYKLSVCQFCGQMYLEGNKDGNVFSQPEVYRNSIFQVLDSEDKEQLNDLSENDDQIGKLYALCTKCSYITEYSGVMGRIGCTCNQDFSIILVQAQFDEEDPVLHACNKCKGINPRGSILRGFYIGSNAASSIIAASMFEQIPYKKIEKPREEKPRMGYKPQNNMDAITKRLLVFSDNRQDAAFFAAYLQTTYTNLLKRRLLLKTARSLAPKYPQTGIPLPKIAHELARNFEL
ncbi:MAG TPA: DEAD/DEAH box helicase, partial [Treponemataceae bacterium]|nr:DEAD/DEAH box helicase [Treponemataceae bacterium]